MKYLSIILLQLIFFSSFCSTKDTLIHKKRKITFSFEAGTGSNFYSLNKQEGLYKNPDGWITYKQYLTFKPGIAFYADAGIRIRIFRFLYYTPVIRYKFDNGFVKYDDGIISNTYNINYYNIEYKTLNFEAVFKIKQKHEIHANLGVGTYPLKKLDVIRKGNFLIYEDFEYYNTNNYYDNYSQMFVEYSVGYKVNLLNTPAIIKFNYWYGLRDFTNIIDFHFYKALYSLPLTKEIISLGIKIII